MGAHDPLDLDFFGVALRVEGVDAQTARMLRTVYERQAPPANGRAPEIVVQVVPVDDGTPSIVVSGRTVLVRDRAELAHQLHLVMVGAAAAACPRARVLHGCAVERSGRALVVLAPSGGGKTTLAVALVGRGWRLLSDDFVVLTGDGAVRPFLRRVNLLPDSVTRLGLALPTGTVALVGPYGRHKWMVDIESLLPGSTSRGGRIGTLVVMQRSQPDVQRNLANAAVSGLPAGADGSQGAERCIAVRLDRIPAGFVRAVETVNGIRSVRLNEAGATLRLSAAPGSRVVRPLEALCAEYGVAVLGVEEAADGFRRSGAPAARPMCVGEAARACLGHDLGLGGRRFLSGTDDWDVLAALMQLRRAFAPAKGRVWSLIPGDLVATLDLLEWLAEASPHSAVSVASMALVAPTSRPAR